MPLTSSAIKALRQDRARAIRNNRQRTALKRALKVVTLDSVSATVSLIDKAVKNHLMHANKAARLKSHLAKTVGIATSKRPGAGATAAKKATAVKPAVIKRASVKKPASKKTAPTK